MLELSKHFASLTAAQGAVRLLGRNGIPARISRTGSKNGCSFAVLVDSKRLQMAEQLLGGSGRGEEA